MSSSTHSLIELYTDGSCSPTNPGPGGWAFIPIVDGTPGEVVSDGERESTNNRMELTAAIEALRFCRSGAQVRVYSDSQYVVKGITEWVLGWQKRNWKRQRNLPVVNADLWQVLVAEDARVNPAWHWVKAHAGNEYNELVDDEARAVAQRIAGSSNETHEDLADNRLFRDE